MALRLFIREIANVCPGGAGNCQAKVNSVQLLTPVAVPGPVAGTGIIPFAAIGLLWLRRRRMQA